MSSLGRQKKKTKPKQSSVEVYAAVVSHHNQVVGELRKHIDALAELRGRPSSAMSEVYRLSSEVCELRLKCDGHISERDSLKEREAMIFGTLKLVAAIGLTVLMVMWLSTYYPRFPQ